MIKICNLYKSQDYYNESNGEVIVLDVDGTLTDNEKYNYELIKLVREEVKNNESTKVILATSASLTQVKKERNSLCKAHTLRFDVVRTLSDAGVTVHSVQVCASRLGESNRESNLGDYYNGTFKDHEAHISNGMCSGAIDEVIKKEEELLNGDHDTTKIEMVNHIISKLDDPDQITLYDDRAAIILAQAMQKNKVRPHHVRCQRVARPGDCWLKDDGWVGSSKAMDKDQLKAVFDIDDLIERTEIHRQSEVVCNYILFLDSSKSKLKRSFD